MKALSKHSPKVFALILVSVSFLSCTKKGGGTGGVEKTGGAGIESGNGAGGGGTGGPGGNAEGYSGMRPVVGTYYFADSRVLPNGIRGKITVRENGATYEGAGTPASEIPLSDLGVTGLGIVDGATSLPPVILYNHNVYGASALPPTTGSTELAPRAYATAAAGGTRYDFVVMAQGPADALLNARVLVLSSTADDPGRLLGDVPVISSNLSESAKVYSGNSFRLETSANGAAVTASVNAVVGGTSLQFLAMTASDTFLTPAVGPASLPQAKLAAGNNFSCGVHAGAAYCWGHNGVSQLGDGTATTRRVPTAVSGLSSGVTKVALGASHACGIKETKLWCWGSNGSGELGTGDTTPSSVPVQITSLASVTDVTAGNNFTCAISGGRPYCWGANPLGNLGTGSDEGALSPVMVTGFASGITAVSIAAGANHVCMLDTQGNASCWGFNLYGQVGIGSPTSKFNSPQLIANQRLVSLSASGDYTCGVSPDGKAFCWGQNTFGSASGDGSIDTTEFRVPTSVSNLNISGLVSSISTGSTHACAIKGGVLLCWGSNSWGEMASGSQGNDPRAVTSVMNVSGASQVACGNHHTLALTSEGFRSFGYGFQGQLGVNGSDNSNVPLSFVFP